MSNCPFKNEQCDCDCALFIKENELNELVVNRLKSIGVMCMDNGGMCSIKNLALAQSRVIFENTKVFKK